METSEKLGMFYQAAIDAANEQSAVMLQEYETGYQAGVAEYEQQRQKEQQARERIALEQVRKEINRNTSEELLRLKREYHAKQEQRKQELFDLVEQKLASYRKSDAYESLLRKKIAKAKELAAGETFTIYIDPEDSALKERLEQAEGCELTVGDRSFGGGIRAVFPGKHMLMDDSFDNRLLEEREKFSF